MISHVFNLISVRTRAADFFELTKFRLVSLVLLSTCAGYYLGSTGSFDFGRLIVTMLGTGLVAAGTMALNQYAEKKEDSLMMRTMNRPIPTGRVQPHEAFIFGIVISLLGIAVLYFAINTAAAFLSALTLITYILIYTPMKKQTPLCTAVGSVPDALPALVGWAAVKGNTSFGAWILFLIIFVWQNPHFMAIAWMLRKDFQAAGFKILSVSDPDGKQVGKQIVYYSIALLPVSLLPTFFHLTGWIYFFGALFLSSAFLWIAIKGWKKMDSSAKGIFRASIIYLTLIFVLMFVNKA